MPPFKTYENRSFSKGPPSESISAIGVGIFVPSALEAIGVEAATVGVETGIPMPKEASVEIGVEICHWR